MDSNGIYRVFKSPFIFWYRSCVTFCSTLLSNKRKEKGMGDAAYPEWYQCPICHTATVPRERGLAPPYCEPNDRHAGFVRMVQVPVPAGKTPEDISILRAELSKRIDMALSSWEAPDVQCLLEQGFQIPFVQEMVTYRRTHQEKRWKGHHLLDRHIGMNVDVVLTDINEKARDLLK